MKQLNKVRLCLFLNSCLVVFIGFYITNFAAESKYFRFGPNEVHLSIHNAKVPATVYAATVMALLLIDKGIFNPELQLFVLGRTAAFKRLGVILVWLFIDIDKGL